MSKSIRQCEALCIEDALSYIILNNVPPQCPSLSVPRAFSPSAFFVPTDQMPSNEMN